MIRIVALMLAISLVSGCGRAESQVAIDGTVRLAGSPAPQIEVVFVADNSEQRTVTDSNGRYQVAGIPTGRYSVFFREPINLNQFAGKKEPGLPGNPARHAQRLQAAASSRIPNSYAARESTPFRDVLIRDGQFRHDFDIPGID